jgi:putative pyruvate formate lyase activating enzyme
MARVFQPCYLTLTEDDWQARIEDSRDLLRAPCRVCPRYCNVDRTDRASKRIGFCRVKDLAVVSSYGPHHGEEDPLRGTRGSGTIFLASCNLACVFCQNSEISQLRLGHEVTDEELAGMMLDLQARGCHNINFVSPSIYVPQVIRATYYAARKGLRLPLVYNTGGYDSPESLALLDGIVDIYMPDAKYSDDAVARRHSLVKGYWDVNRAALKEMHRQVGVLQVGEDGLATRGVLVRHLVLPEGLAGTREVARFLASELSPDTYVNVMAQYRPANKAAEYPPLDRPVRAEEVAEAVDIAQQEGLRRFDHRRPNIARYLWTPR